MSGFFVVPTSCYHCGQEAGDAAAADELTGAAPLLASGKAASDGSHASETAHFEAIKEQKSSLENGIAAFNRYPTSLSPARCRHESVMLLKASGRTV